LAKVLEPGTAVKLGVVLLDEAEAVNLHVVDTIDREFKRNNSPSPGDGVAIVPDVKDLNRNFRLLLTLTDVEVLLAVECDGAKGNTSHEIDRVGNINEVNIEGSV
jgi:hypothetical protein